MPNQVARILKVRWAEAVMLIGLFAGLSALTARVSQEFYSMDTIERLPFWSAFGLGAGLMTLSILLGTLFAGFLRSAALEPLIPRQPSDLLRIGRPYFWKLFLPYLVFNLLLTLLALLLLTLLHFLLYQKPPAEQIPDWLLRLCQMIALALLIKPFLLVPNLMILQDLPIPAALVRCRGLAMRKMKELMKTVQIGFLLILTVFGLLLLIPFPKHFFWIHIGLFSIVSGSVFLVFFLTAMLEISRQIRPASQETP
jgi:hypothetical protein